MSLCQNGDSNAIFFGIGLVEETNLEFGGRLVIRLSAM